MALVRAEAGLRWDPFVDWTLARGLWGLENLALIPGQCGAAPIQNIGAYGVELSETIVAVEAFDRSECRLRRLAATECAFAYRDSAFKQEPERWIVISLELQLQHRAAPKLGYAGLRDELDSMGGLTATATNVAAAVRRIRRANCRIRRAGNAGSFSVDRCTSACENSSGDSLQHRCLPAPTRHTQLSAAWLIERAGWRGHREGAAGVSRSMRSCSSISGATGAQLRPGAPYRQLGRRTVRCPARAGTAHRGQCILRLGGVSRRVRS
jgi:UDP-N-acetylmuramate dehydrogenase